VKRAKTISRRLRTGRRAMDKELGWFHACSAYPLSDLKVKVPIMQTVLMHYVN